MGARAAAVIAVTAAILAWGAPAQAKGMAGATIQGDGIDGTIAVTFDGGDRTGAALVEDSGVYDLVWEGATDRTLPRAPTTDLGPKVVVTWLLHGPNGEVPIVQDLHPFAAGGPVAHLAPGQPMWDRTVTAGGWIRARAGLAATLASLGVPGRTAPAAAAREGSDTDWAPIGASVTAVLALGIGLALVSRRRGEAAPAVG